MKLSTRSRYGVKIMVDLAERYDEGPIRVRDIAKRQNISVKYLEQLMAILKSAGFVRSIRGSKGGYLLAKQPNQVKLDEVFNVLEGHVATVECVEDESYCTRVSDCIARQIWVEVQEAIMSVLQSITLQDLIDRAKNDKAMDYHI